MRSGRFQDQYEKLKSEHNRLRRLLDAARGIKVVYSLLPGHVQEEATQALEDEDIFSLKLILKDS